jgi:bacillithiol system protein YtxJ
VTPNSLKDRIHTLSSPEQVDAFLRTRTNAALLKLGSCHKNVVALREVEAQLASRENLELGLIRVLEARPASQHVAALTGIVHESPQLILFHQGRAVYDRDNWDITPEAVAEGLQALDAAAEPEAELAARD